MSQENVELVERILAEYGRTKTAVRWALDPEIEWHVAADLPDSEVLHGVDEVNAFLRSFSDTFSDFRADVQRYVDAGDCVVVPMILHGRMKGSNQEVTLQETHVWRIRNGKAVEVREYRDEREALKAVGLEE